MNTFFAQFVKIYNNASLSQKTSAFFVLVCVSGALLYLVMRGSSAAYTPLFKNTITSQEETSVKLYLEQESIPFKVQKEKGIMIPESYLDRARLELLEANIPKRGQGKGFELFDTNTWIKGEKELQVLEMRALKGQLEKDLAAFDHIKSASVILDIPPSRSLTGNQYKTKASVILTLMPGSRLSNSQLRAISFHLSGAVRGLQPHMIAISDTTGRLYKAIEEEPNENELSIKAVLLEEQLQEKIDSFLKKMIKESRYFLNIRTFTEKGVETLAISVIIDERLVLEKKWDKDLFTNEITKHLWTILAGYGKEIKLVVDTAPFAERKLPSLEKSEKSHYTGLFITLFVIVLAIFSAFPLFKRVSKKQKEIDENSLFDVMTKVDLRKLADSVKNEDPKTIAMMVSYLEPERAEKIIRAFPEDIQEAILVELEREET